MIKIVSCTCLCSHYNMLRYVYDNMWLGFCITKQSTIFVLQYKFHNTEVQCLLCIYMEIEWLDLEIEFLQCG